MHTRLTLHHCRGRKEAQLQPPHSPPPHLLLFFLLLHLHSLFSSSSTSDSHSASSFLLLFFSCHSFSYSSSSFGTESNHAPQAGLEPTVLLLPWPPEYWVVGYATMPSSGFLLSSIYLSLSYLIHWDATHCGVRWQGGGLWESMALCLDF